MSRLCGPVFLYLLAGYFLMPFAATRALGESVAMTWVLLGVGAFTRGITRGSVGWLLLGLIGVGMAALFRYQAGILCLWYAGCCLVWGFSERRRGTAFGIVLGAAVLTIAVEVLVEHIGGRAPFETLRTYLAMNENGGASSGAQPWYTLIVVTLGLAFFPLSLFLGKSWQRVGQLFPRELGAVLLFVAIHSAMTHKEERFLLPILPLIVLGLAVAAGETWERRPRRRSGIAMLGGVNIVLLLLVTLSTSQGAQLEPVIKAQRTFHSTLLLDADSGVSGNWIATGFFAYRPIHYADATLSDLTPGHLADWGKKYPDVDGIAIAVGATPEAESALRRLTEPLSPTPGWSCTGPEEVASLTDAWIYRMNPTHNRRRRPVLLVLCRRSRT